ncbi:Translocon-associated protein subunit delta [Orchesella cincta]|uniref:Translocon-associated protein subunit delta n=1 Tax=Orchesella cincta TaxID=48709 RepID=A0A1D2NFC5_ORCCI|nr:Translocon-associated protein subunit delta [Orchesella cincta]
MKGFLVVFAVLTASSVALASNCQVSNQRTYTTQDASVLTSIAYITEFELTCDGKKVVGTQLYAESQGSILQVGENNGNYQVSWVEDLALATKGDHPLRIVDDEGVSVVRKAQKTGASIDGVKPLASLILNHPGAYTGPWLSSEHLAAIMGVVVVYVAVTSKSKLLA